MSVSVRPGVVADLERIHEIYNHYVANTAITFELEPVSMDARREWFSQFATAGRHRLFVATLDGEVAGYAGSSRYSPRGAYDTTVSTSVYCADAARGRGLGTALYKALFDSISGEDLHRAEAGVTMPNEASVALHGRFGFVHVGTFTEQGRKFGRYWDVARYEKRL